MSPESQLAGRYDLVRLVARGGMGEVWAARHRELGIEVAVKVLLARDPQPAEVTRFRREAQATAALRSAHVVRVLDCGHHDGHPFLVMELLHGETLAELLERRVRLDLRDAVALVNQACRGLHAAHQAGIVHRDIKPSNLFLAREDGKRVLKVLDFGVAQVDVGPLNGGDKTASGTLFGTWSYMSPEQARGQRLGPASDIWSLAVVAMEAITGSPVFPARHPGEAIAAICSDPLPVPSRRAPDLPREIDLVFARALQRNPAARFRDALELARAFEAAAGPALAAAARGRRDEAGLFDGDEVRAGGAGAGASTEVGTGGHGGDDTVDAGPNLPTMANIGRDLPTSSVGSAAQAGAAGTPPARAEARGPRRGRVLAALAAAAVIAVAGTAALRGVSRDPGGAPAAPAAAAAGSSPAAGRAPVTPKPALAPPAAVAAPAAAAPPPPAPPPPPPAPAGASVAAAPIDPPVASVAAQRRGGAAPRAPRALATAEGRAVARARRTRPAVAPSSPTAAAAAPAVSGPRDDFSGLPLVRPAARRAPVTAAEKSNP